MEAKLSMVNIFNIISKKRVKKIEKVMPQTIQKKIISEKKESNPNKPQSKKFPQNLPISDYVTIKEKKFKNLMNKPLKKHSPR